MGKGSTRRPGEGYEASYDRIFGKVKVGPEASLPMRAGKPGQIYITSGTSIEWKDPPPSPVLDAIRAAMNEYYDALTERQHGGVAMDRAFYKIQNALGMSWEQRKAEQAKEE